LLRQQSLPTINKSFRSLLVEAKENRFFILKKGDYMPEFQIDGYAFREWSSRPTNNLNPGVAVAGVYLYQGGNYRGYIYFFPDGTPLAPPVFDAANGRIFLHLNLSQFHGTMEILRTEKPLYVYYIDPSNAALRSGVEPTGEEE